MPTKTVLAAYMKEAEVQNAKNRIRATFLRKLSVKAFPIGAALWDAKSAVFDEVVQAIPGMKDHDR